nr:MAG TPA: hypothetical protein [Caudoviricetes sp.]
MSYYIYLTRYLTKINRSVLFLHHARHFFTDFHLVFQALRSPILSGYFRH